MGRNRIVISLSRGMVFASRLDGGEAAPITFDPELWERAWQEGLRPLDGALAQALKRLGVSRPRVVLLHTGPDCVVEMPTYQTSTREAISAARLGLSDASSLSLETNPWSVVALGHDRAGATQALTAIDSEASAAAVTRWIERAGGIVESVTPFDAAALEMARAHVLDESGDEPRAALVLSEQASVLLAAAEGHLEVVRRIDVGVELFVEAYKRALEMKGTAGEEDLWGAARSLLERFGAPDRDATLDERRRVVGADVLPFLQPVLQRLVVEVRQSFRFGLSDRDRERVRIDLAGPGAAIPRIAEVLSAELELAVEVVGADEPLGRLGLLGAGRGYTPSINLPPAEGTERVMGRRIAAGLAVGVSAACIAIAAEAHLTRGELKSARQELATLTPQLEQLRIVDARRMETLREITALETARRSGEAQMGVHSDWGALLRLLSTITPEGIELDEIGGSQSRSGLQVRLRGHCLTSSDGGDAISDFLQRVEASPLVQSVSLGATQQAQVRGAEARYFELDVRLVGIPTELGLASVEEDGE
ncbi:MAG: PilN domain-containing protein [Planctomycetota bacterium]|nr:PilN domain-containing protein [Planctomycetota bacterium]